MLRGVNKRVIEIRHPEEKAFERIVIFLHPGWEVTDERLTREAAQCEARLSEQWRTGGCRKRRRRLWLGLRMGAAALAGGAAVFGLLCWR